MPERTDTPRVTDTRITDIRGFVEAAVERFPHLARLAPDVGDDSISLPDAVIKLRYFVQSYERASRAAEQARRAGAFVAEQRVRRLQRAHRMGGRR